MEIKVSRSYKRKCMSRIREQRQREELKKRNGTSKMDPTRILNNKINSVPWF